MTLAIASTTEKNAWSDCDSFITIHPGKNSLKGPTVVLELRPKTLCADGKERCCAHDLDNDFHELFRDPDIADSSDGAIYFLSPTFQEFELEVASCGGESRGAQDETGSCHRPGLIVK